MVDMNSRNNAEDRNDTEEQDGPMDPRDLLEELILAVIENPSEMKVHEIVEDGKTILEVRVGDADRGKVIGKGGSIAYSLRNLFYLVGQKNGISIEVRIDAGPNHKARPRNNRPNNFNQNQFVPQGMMLVPVQANFGGRQYNGNQRRFNRG